MVERARIKFETDGGPWVRHNMPCAIYWDLKPAVFDLNNNTFQPSWSAQEEGWMLVKATGWRASLIRFLSRSKEIKSHE
ncbi:hypothetical protein CFBP6626_07520 [Agrobacterium tumefaciens]|nr:hypothetical protein CFBP6626_07520 [Agrobacterium tumefaciens]CUX07639.1 hypothetical protein AGR5A_Cc10017 [Agrobacterium genomosp. 5 str. CFBP 6626]